MHDEENKNHVRRRHGPMGGPPGVGGKPKNFKKSLKKIMSYSKVFMPFIIVALVFAIASSIFSIIGPNKLSDLTDEISNGLVLNVDNFKALQEDITTNLNEERLTSLSKDILQFNIDQNSMQKLYTSANLTINQKQEIMKSLSSIDAGKDILEVINSLPYNAKLEIISNSTINGVDVSAEDKLEYMNFLNTVKENDSKENMDVSALPESIQKLLLPESKIANKNITTADKLEFINIMSSSGITKDSIVTDIYNVADKFPENIKEIIKPTMNLDVIKKISMFLLIIYCFSAISNFAEGFIMATVANRLAKKLRTNISVKINKLPLRYFDKHSYGDILSRVTNDVDQVGQSISQSLGTFVSAVTLLIGAIAMMIYTNWIMAITAMLSSLIGFILMFVILGKSQKYFIARQEELGKMNGHIEEIYSGYNVVKVYNGQEKANNKFDILNKNLFECNRKSQFLSGLMQPLMNFIGNFSYVAVCVVGAILAMNGNITFGVIVAFMVYIRLFTGPLSQIAQSFTSLQSALASSERVFEFIEENEMPDESSKEIKLDKKDAKGEIEFEHVHFQYDNNPKPTIIDFSAKAKSGQKIAIVGPTGAGKTTIVNLIMKFYELTGGDIKIDGISNKDLTRENIHDLFIMVLQDTWLFEGTVRENIVYNQKNVSDDKVMEVCKMVGLEHFIKSLPNGLDTIITDSDSVSSGQRQLITIARGMIKNAPFLILDEATSNVDTRTEEVVQKAMDKLTEGRTSFIIAHRLSTIKNADLILVINNGNIIEQGNHEELLQKGGFYADLYNSQFEDVG